MPEINQLSAMDELQASDQLPVYDSSAGDARKSSVSLLLEYIQNNLVFPDGDAFIDYTTQYAAPSSTGFSVTIDSDTDDPFNVHLILTPTGGFAAGTLVLPVNSGLVDKQELLVNCTQSVTTLTITGNGATVTGAPTTLAANAFFRLKYDLATNVWYRVG